MALLLSLPAGAQTYGSGQDQQGQGIAIPPNNGNAGNGTGSGTGSSSGAGSSGTDSNGNAGSTADDGTGQRGLSGGRQGQQGANDGGPPLDRQPAFTFSPTGSIQGTYTDNVLLTTNNTQADWLTTLTGGLDVVGKTERSQVVANYSVSGDIYTANPQLDGYRQSLITLDRFEPVKGKFLIDFRASLDQEQIAQTGQQAATLRSGLINQTQVANASITPSYVEKWGNWATSTLSYSVNQVAYFSGGNNGGGSTASNDLNDSTQQTITAQLASGSRFTRTTWNLTLSDNSSNGSGTRTDQQTTEADAEYRISSTYRIPVTVGYDNFSQVESGFTANSLSGIFWNTGIHLVPGPRTDLTLRYGRRYDKPYENGLLTYKVLPNVQLVATYDVAVQTQQQALAGGLAGIGLGAGGTPVSPVGGVAAPNATGTSLVNAIFRSRTLVVGLNGTHGKNFFSLNGQMEARSFGTTQGSDRSEGINGSVGRNLTATTNVSFTASTEHSVSSASISDLGVGAANSVQYGMNVAHKLSDKTDLSFDVTRRQQSGTFKTDEDAIVIQLSHKF